MFERLSIAYIPLFIICFIGGISFYQSLDYILRFKNGSPQSTIMMPKMIYEIILGADFDLGRKAIYDLKWIENLAAWRNVLIYK